MTIIQSSPCLFLPNSQTKQVLPHTQPPVLIFTAGWATPFFHVSFTPILTELLILLMKTQNKNPQDMM